MRFLQGAGALIIAGVMMGAMAGCSGNAAKTEASAKPEAPASAANGAETVGTVYTKVKKSVAEAKSVHHAGTFATVDGSSKADFFGQLDGSNTKEVVESELGKMTSLQIDGVGYMQGDAKYIGVNFPGKEKEYAGKWLLQKTAAEGASSESPDGLNESPGVTLNKWLTAGTAPALEKDSKPATKKGETYEIKSSDGTIITVNAKDFSLKKLVLSPTSESAGTFEFDQWNAVAPFPVPPAAETIEIKG